MEAYEEKTEEEGKSSGSISSGQAQVAHEMEG